MDLGCGITLYIFTHDFHGLFVLNLLKYIRIHADILKKIYIHNDVLDEGYNVVSLKRRSKVIATMELVKKKQYV